MRTLTQSLLLVLSLTIASTRALASNATGDIEERAPSPQAKAHTWYRSLSKGGLQYAWLVPKDYDGKTARNLSVILHGTGLDYRWGPANNPAGVFRPDDVVVSVDGTSPDGQTRLFLGEKKDADAFAAFLGEMRAAFAVKNVFLYGHSQGGFFVVYFAGEHPDLVSGVVAHSSGAWNWSKMTAPVKKVAIAFMHGTLDPVVPYVQSPGSRDAYAKEGFKLLHLRRLSRWNHWPNAIRATECLDWCEGMTTDDPALALDAAKRILRVKKTDEYQWQTVVGFAGARDVLRRIEGKGPAPFADVPPKIAEEAAQITKSVEEHGAKHVKVLEKQVAARKDLKLGGEWLGHLVPLREDFRGVDSVEAYIKKIGFDEELESQNKAANEIADAWYNSKDEKKIFTVVVTKIGDAFLHEGLPFDLAKKMDEWKGQAKSLGLGKKDLEKAAAFDAWKKGWEKGLEQYQSVWKDWKGP